MSSEYKYNIEDIKVFAEKNNGKCLSEQYKGVGYKYDFICERGHRFSSSFTNIRKNWCASCNDKKISEQICRAYLEYIFNEKFYSCRPDWLKNPKTGKNLELDGFCEKLKIAFEHQGIQHYDKNHKFYSDNMIERDKIKLELCKKNNIKLIVIPAVGDILKKENLTQFILDECLSLNIDIRETFNKNENIKVDIQFSDSIERYNYLKELVENKKGKILSDFYYGAHIKLNLECEFGHKFETSPVRLKSGSWCPVCSHRVIKTIEDMQKIAKNKGGKCLSNQYDFKAKLKWECNEGHIFYKKHTDAKNHWCSVCKKLQRVEYCIKRYESIKIILKKINYGLISEEYESNIKKLTVVCDKNHIFQISARSIFLGRKCKICFKNDNKNK